MIALTQAVVAPLVPKRARESFKGTYGHVLCIGGNARYGGAILIAAAAAQRMGAGLVSVACDPRHHSALHASHPEVMALDWHDTHLVAELLASVDIVLIGCGLGRDAMAQQLLAAVCHTRTKPVIFDADALFLLATQPEQFQPQMPRIYTPHLGEWARFAHDPHLPVAAQAKALAPVVVLKSAKTHIYTPTQTYVVVNGTPAMASGGMGDCLAGSIAGMLAQHVDLAQAACIGAFVHSEAASRLAATRYCVSASEVSSQLPFLLHELSTVDEI